MCFGMWLLWPFTRILALHFWEKDKCPDDLIAAGKSAKALKQIEKCHKSGAQERLNALTQQHHSKETYKVLGKDFKPVLICGTVLIIGWNFTGFPYLLSWTESLYAIALYPYSGLNYGTKIWDDALGQNYCVLFAGLIVIGAIIGWVCVDAIGRKITTLAGLAVCAVCMLIVCILGYGNPETNSGTNMGNMDSSGTVTVYTIWAAGYGIFSAGGWAWMQDALPRKAWGPMMAKFFFIIFILQLFWFDTWFSSLTDISGSFVNGTKLMGLYCCIISFVCCGLLAVLMKETKGKTHAEIMNDYGVKASKIQSELVSETDRHALGNQTKQP